MALVIRTGDAFPVITHDGHRSRRLPVKSDSFKHVDQPKDSPLIVGSEGGSAVPTGWPLTVPPLDSMPRPGYLTTSWPDSSRVANSRSNWVPFAGEVKTFDFGPAGGTR